jgi:FAD:protein FMN transferase
VGSTEFAESEQLGMNTVMTHRAFGAHAENALQAVHEEAMRLEGLLSRFLPESDIGRINRSAGIRSESVSGETIEVLSRATALSRRCRGLFDITIAPLVSLWNNAKAANKPPEYAEILEILPLVDFRICC